MEGEGDDDDNVIDRARYVFIHYNNHSLIYILSTILYIILYYL
jgi:hypothetical protein